MTFFSFGADKGRALAGFHVLELKNLIYVAVNIKSIAVSDFACLHINLLCFWITEKVFYNIVFSFSSAISSLRIL